MDKIELKYQIELDYNDKKIVNVIIADQKDTIDKVNEIICNGVLYIDLILDDNSCDHKEKSFNFSLNKEKYHQKELTIKIDDYKFEQNENKLLLVIDYIICGTDVNFDNLCILDNDDLKNELRNYLSRGEQKEVDESYYEKIKLIDPIIEEKSEKVEIIEDKNIVKKEDILKETYVSSFLFYRVKKYETIEEIAKKFNLTKEEIIKNNNDKEIKENCLIQIKKNA